jgi:hypothetical protein
MCLFLGEGEGLGMRWFPCLTAAVGVPCAHSARHGSARCLSTAHPS